MSGINLLLKYSYSPNLSGFCGPRNTAIIQEARLSSDGSAVTGISDALESFIGAVPYYELIAQSNHIRDPFDWRVVEAYWIGNDLLNNVSVADLYNHLRERFRHRVKPKTLDLIARQAPLGAKPHHSYHVFDAFTKTGGFDRLGISDAALNRIDECRIGWGIFEKYTNNTKSQIIVKYQPIESQLSIVNCQLFKEKIISNEIDGYKLFTDLKKCDLITFHWSRICDKISQDQARRLKTWTNYHWRLSN